MSRQLEKFEIFFENETAVFHEGSNVTGMVIIESDEDITYKNIRIELRGVAIVFWGSQEEKEGAEKTGAQIDETKGECNKEQYFQKVILLEKEGNLLDKDPILQAGQHSFPFACRLLPELPSSFEGRFGRVRYEAQAIITQSMFKKDIIVKRSFTVVNGLDLSFIPEAAAKIEICKYREVGMCCTEGSITFDWLVERSGFISGEDIWIQGSVQNDSKHSVSQSAVTLYMVIDYRANKKRRQEKKLILSVEKGSTLTDDITVWNEPIHIPDLPPTGLNRCRLIDIRYELEFKATIDGSSQPVLVTKEIYIGTVPLVIRPSTTVGCKSSTWDERGSDDDWTSADGDAHCTTTLVPGPPYYCGPAVGYPCGNMTYSSACRFSLTDLIAATVSSISSATTDPSAPLLAVLEGPIDEHRPPPFAPGHNNEKSAASAGFVGNGTTTVQNDVDRSTTVPVNDPSSPHDPTLEPVAVAVQQQQQHASDTPADDALVDVGDS